ncbi:hypothetical protein ACWCQQ_31750 [Streptomyces sp. NPDC002143]
MAGNRLLAEVMYEQISSGGARVIDLMGALLESAKKQGGIRLDATVTDLRILAGGSAKQLAHMGIADMAEWRRYGELVLATLRRV